MLRYTVRELRVRLGERPEDALCRILCLNPNDILSVRPVRRSVDSRRKPPVWVYNLEILLSRPIRFFPKGVKVDEGWKEAFRFSVRRASSSRKVVVVGFGPAGIFASYLLSRMGVSCEVVERGKPIEERVGDIELLFKEGRFHPESNVLFGEGGAGAFSDGKLTTRIRSPFVELFKRILMDFGVSGDVFLSPKPHIGTDGVRNLVVSMRRYLLDVGVRVNFSERLVGVAVKDGRVVAAITDKREIPCDTLILATGHSARDVYSMLRSMGVPMEPKTFSIGLRVEHPADYIDKLFYGDIYEELPKAEYQLSVRFGERGVYTFCMCPGGFVINASSEPDGLNTNGMSYSGRSGKFSNSAVCVNVFPGDIEGDDPLKGVEFQRFWERRAFGVRGNFLAPCQNLVDFMEGILKREIHSTYRPGVFPHPMDDVLPKWATEYIREGIKRFNGRFKGFVTDAASLVGPEMRTSSPVRILRNSKGESLGIRGVFPVGEGSGYAGGIVSSAVDAMRVVSKIVEGGLELGWVTRT